MKHIKKFEEYLIPESVEAMAYIWGAAAALKIIYNTIKRYGIVSKIEKYDFSKLKYIVGQFKDDKTIIGKIIDNEQECQIIYEYGGSDNLITLHLDKVKKVFTFNWEFTMPIFPFMRHSNYDNVEIQLYESYDEVLEIFESLKKESFKQKSKSKF
jgi:hypothetical protein